MKTETKSKNEAPSVGRPEGLAETHCYDALRADIERCLSEARLTKAEFAGEGKDQLRAHWYGRIAALTVLLQADDDRRKAQHNSAI